MKYRVGSSGFPVGQWLIPAGTLIDTDAADQWSTLCRGLSPPVDAVGRRDL
jgi:hypothetical protein